VKFAEKEYGVKAEKIPVSNKKDLLKRSGISNLQDPFTGDMVPAEQVTIVPFQSDGRTLYDIGRLYPEGHDGHLQPRRQGFGMTGYETPEDAVAHIRELIEHTDTPTETTEVWRIPITEEMKRKVLLEGQYFSKNKSKPASPGGRDAEAVA
jgi:hypothetical protein